MIQIQTQGHYIPMSYVNNLMSASPLLITHVLLLNWCCFFLLRTYIIDTHNHYTYIILPATYLPCMSFTLCFQLVYDYPLYIVPLQLSLYFSFFLGLILHRHVLLNILKCVSSHHPSLLLISYINYVNFLIVSVDKEIVIITGPCKILLTTALATQRMKRN